MLRYSIECKNNTFIVAFTLKESFLTIVLLFFCDLKPKPLLCTSNQHLYAMKSGAKADWL